MADWLNYHHLLYFFTVAREGGVARAAKRLHLSQSAVSAQLRTFQRNLGQTLLQRDGRGVALTEMGRVAYRYAEEIFGLGRELGDAMRGRPTGTPSQLIVGVADVIPKLVAYELLSPALALPEPVQLICREDRPERLLAELALHNLDVVLSDGPIGPGVNVRAFNHLLGECGTVVVGAPALARRFRPGFPGSLDQAPLLMPAAGTVLRRSLDGWLDQHGLRPHVAGEFEDSALIKTFAQAGAGLTLVPEVIEAEVARQYQLRRVGRLTEVRERYYAISVERRLRHPAVVAISHAARNQLFQARRRR